MSCYFYSIFYYVIYILLFANDLFFILLFLMCFLYWHQICSYLNSSNSNVDILGCSSSILGSRTSKKYQDPVDKLSSHTSTGSLAYSQNPTPFTIPNSPCPIISSAPPNPMGTASTSLATSWHLVADHPEWLPQCPVLTTSSRRPQLHAVGMGIKEGWINCYRKMSQKWSKSLKASWS